jgi:ABC-2 type transport system ATP-binding protein
VAAAITIDNLTKRYDRHTAVDNLTLTVGEGESYALLGPNGAGKTTTVEILEGLRERTEGSVTVLGLDPVKDHRELHRHIGVMLQEGGISPATRPLEALRLFAAFHDDPRDIDELVHLTGLSGMLSTPYRRLSGGEKQRLSLALALVGNPRVLFLDEPTAGMDPVARRTTWAIVDTLHREGVTTLLTTHYMDEAERLSDQIGIINNGRLVAEGTPSELIQRSGTVTLLTQPGLPTAAFPLPMREIAPGQYVVDVEGVTPDDLVTLVTFLAKQDILLRELRVGATGLEDVFLELTAED